LTGTDPGGTWTEDLTNLLPAGVAFANNCVDISLLPAVTGSGTFVFDYDFGAAQNCTPVGTSVELVNLLFCLYTESIQWLTLSTRRVYSYSNDYGRSGSTCNRPNHRCM